MRNPTNFYPAKGIIDMNFKKKLMICAMTVASVVAIGVGSASACTMIYVGSDLTTDIYHRAG